MPFWDHEYSYISQKCRIYRMESLHEYRDLCFVLDYINGKLKSEVMDRNFIERNLNYNLRYPRQFSESTHRNKFIYFAPIFRLARSWNTLPIELRHNLMEGCPKEWLKKEVLKSFN